MTGIAVLTTGLSGLDFTEVAGSTCSATTYTASTPCTVNVAFKASASGLRRGAVVFYTKEHNETSVLASVPVFGIGTGPQVVYAPTGSPVNVGGHLTSPEGLAVDANGDVFVSDTALQQVFEIKPNGSQVTVGSGFQVPEGVAVDGAGNVYVTDTQLQTVFKITPHGVQTTVGKGWQYPFGAAVDGQGNLYVSDPYIPTVYKLTPSGTQTMIGSGYNGPSGVAVDASGNVYVTDPYNAAVYKITPSGKQTTVDSELITPIAVAVDAAGNLYVTDAGTSRVYSISPDGAQSTISHGLDVPNGIALGRLGDLYVADTYKRQVVKIERSQAPALTFKSTKIGTTSSDSPKIVEVANVGNGPLNFSAVTYPVDFPEDADAEFNDCTANTSLVGGNTCFLTIEFSPTSPLGSKTSAVLKEFVKLDFSIPKFPAAALSVSGTETSR